ncbi:hypothetical protein sos41_05450 [Alphaproteobacteria bacterium SO-S41]|nr:hypothetical protein sos41_05450 [Alphaproteobacteria bacterium SO-S41]
MLNRRQLLAAACAVPFAGWARAEIPAPAAALIAAARAQIGVTLYYDSGYRQIAYPMGDVPRDTGVCTDVVIRAYRDAVQRDLQVLVHEDMRVNFSKYPNVWGLAGPDRNIDHRRVPNLMTFLKRAKAQLVLNEAPQPGDLVTMIVPPHLPHIAIVSDALSDDGKRLKIIHNIGRGTREEDRIEAFERIGHYRWMA